MTAAAHLPEPHRCSAADPDIDGLEPSPEWTGDATAATKFGDSTSIFPTSSITMTSASAVADRKAFTPTSSRALMSTP